MIPHPLACVVLVLAAYRWTRLLGWDDLPPILRARAWALGEAVHVSGSSNSAAGLTSEQPYITVTYRRPLLAHFVHCAFCLGFWVSCLTYAAWLLWPRPTLYAAGAFALSAAVGLVAKNLDP